MTINPSIDDEKLMLKEYYKKIKSDIDKINQRIEQYSQDISENQGEKEKLADVMVVKGRMSKAVELADNSNALLPQAYFGELIYTDKNNEVHRRYIGTIPYNSKYSDIRIYGMNAPFVRMFYSKKGSYTANNKMYTCDLQLVRNLEVSHDNLKSISDDVNTGSIPYHSNQYLKKQLQKSGSARRERVYTTLHEEQFDAIQVSPSKSLVIQGGAGVGKTIVLLHRINYLIYEAQNKAEDILVIGPNRLFLDQVSNILPGLSVTGVKQISLDELVYGFLNNVVSLNHKIDIVNPFDTGEQVDYKQAIAYKAQNNSETELKILIDKAVVSYLYTLGDYIDSKRKIIVSNSEIVKHFIVNVAGKSMSYEDKINRIAMFILNEVLSQAEQLVKDGIIDTEGAGLLGRYANEKERQAWEKNNIHLKQIKKFVSMPNKKELFKLSVLPLYFSQYATLIKWLEKKDDPLLLTFKLMDSLFTLEDLGCIFYLYLELFRPQPIYKYILVDEAQYLSPIWIRCFQFLLKENGRINLCGDMNQKTFYSATDNWDVLTKTLDDVELVELNKNYRTTEEIIKVAKWVLKKVRPKVSSKINGVGRHGDPLNMIDCEKQGEDLANVIVDEISNFSQLKNDDQLLIKTVGVISPTESASSTLKQQIKEILPPGSSLWNLLQINFLPVSSVGGLEFDAVIITDFDMYSFDNLDEASMFYTAVTRAAHKLTIVKN